MDSINQAADNPWKRYDWEQFPQDTSLAVALAFHPVPPTQGKSILQILNESAEKNKRDSRPGWKSGTLDVLALANWALENLPKSAFGRPDQRKVIEDTIEALPQMQDQAQAHVFMKALPPFMSNWVRSSSQADSVKRTRLFGLAYDVNMLLKGENAAKLQHAFYQSLPDNVGDILDRATPPGETLEMLGEFQEIGDSLLQANDPSFDIAAITAKQQALQEAHGRGRKRLSTALRETPPDPEPPPPPIDPSEFGPPAFASSPPLTTPLPAIGDGTGNGQGFSTSLDAAQHSMSSSPQEQSEDHAPPIISPTQLPSSSSTSLPPLPTTEITDKETVLPFSSQEPIKTDSSSLPAIPQLPASAQATNDLPVTPEHSFNTGKKELPSLPPQATDGVRIHFREPLQPTKFGRLARQVLFSTKFSPKLRSPYERVSMPRAEEVASPQHPVGQEPPPATLAEFIQNSASQEMRVQERPRHHQKKAGLYAYTLTDREGKKADLQATGALEEIFYPCSRDPKRFWSFNKDANENWQAHPIAREGEAPGATIRYDPSRPSQRSSEKTLVRKLLGQITR